MSTMNLENRTIPCGLLDAQALQDDQHWLVVDVRTPAEFSEAHIPGSINMPLADLDQHLPALRARGEGKQVLLVCRSGGRASQALAQLERAGMSNCRVLDGGLSAWVEAGKPVRRGRKAFSIERQVRVVAGALVVLGTVLGAFVSPWFLLLPAFVGSGLVFAGLTDTCGMALVLARLPFNRAPRPTSAAPTCCGSRP